MDSKQKWQSSMNIVASIAEADALPLVAGASAGCVCLTAEGRVRGEHLRATRSEFRNTLRRSRRRFYLGHSRQNAGERERTSPNVCEHRPVPEAPRRRGRPPLDDNDASVPVSLKIPSREYDLLYARASRERVSVPEQIRREIRAGAKRTRQLE